MVWCQYKWKSQCMIHCKYWLPFAKTHSNRTSSTLNQRVFRITLTTFTRKMSEFEKQNVQDHEKDCIITDPNTVEKDTAHPVNSGSKLQNTNMKMNKKQKTSKSLKVTDQAGFRVRVQESRQKDPEYEVEIDGPLRKIKPYFFEYNTFCKLRWRDRNLYDVFITEFRDKSKEAYQKTIEDGDVLVNGQVADMNTIVRNGDCITHRAHKHEPPITSKEIKIVFEDENVMVIDKPSGIPAHPVGRYRFNSVSKLLFRQLGYPAHPSNRLDRLTSGLMFLAKNPTGAEEMRTQLVQREVSKEYVARVVGEFPVGEITVDIPLKSIEPRLGLCGICHDHDDPEGKNAKTVFRRISYDGETSIVRCKPYTGRSHQIRVHLQYLGHPIANDPMYSSLEAWGPTMGKNGDANFAQVCEILDQVGKTKSASSWFHPHSHGEVLKDEKCEICGSDIYTDPGPNDLSLWLHSYKYESTDPARPWTYKTEFPDWALETHKKYMELAIKEAEKCEPTTTAFGVGAVLVSGNTILATGYSRELEGNTHAEQNCFAKLTAAETDIPEGSCLYTTMEPCSTRLSGNKPCLDRILEYGQKITTVFVGVMEPATFVKNNVSLEKLQQNDIDYILIPGYEQQCIAAAEKGHETKVGA